MTLFTAPVPVPVVAFVVPQREWRGVRGRDTRHVMASNTTSVIVLSRGMIVPPMRERPRGVRPRASSQAGRTRFIWRRPGWSSILNLREGPGHRAGEVFQP